MIRDRMAALKEALGEEEETDGGGGGGVDGNPSDVTVQIEINGQQADMDRFLAQVSEVRGTLDRMKDTVDRTKKLHCEILSSSHTDDKSKLQLDDLAADFKKCATSVKTKVKELSKEVESFDTSNPSTNQRMKKSQHSALSREFVAIMNDNNTVQGDYRDKCKGKIQRQLEITGRTTTDEELDEMLEQGNVEVFTKGILKETQQAKQQLHDIEERHAEILKLETSIRELHDMFVDMAVLVESQGEMVDNIEQHVTQATDWVETAKVQTTQAAKYQTKARKKKIMIGICLLVLLVIIIIIIAVSV